MHRKYGSQGVVCLSVSLDLLEKRQAALTFLKSKNADFPNYLLDEEQEFWQAKFNIKAPPAVFVFDRGHWSTNGKAVFNMNPDEALRHFQHQYERVEAAK